MQSLTCTILLISSIMVMLLSSGCATNDTSATKNDTFLNELKNVTTLDELNHLATFLVLDRLEKQNPRKVKLFEQLMANLPKQNTAKKIAPYLKWLHSKVYAQSNEAVGDSFRYAMIYAFYLQKAKKTDEAQSALLYGQLRLETDFNRCENQNNSLSKYTGWYEGGNKGQAILAQFNKRKNKQDFTNAAVLLEHKHKDRPGNPWLCSSINWAKAAANFDNLDTSKIKRKDQTTTISVKATEDILHNAAFITNKQWFATKQEVIAKFKQKYIEN